MRNLAVVYTLAGADCIDVAAEEAVIEAARCDLRIACLNYASFFAASKLIEERKIKGTNSKAVIYTGTQTRRTGTRSTTGEHVVFFIVIA